MWYFFPEDPENGFLSAGALAGRDDMEIMVTGNRERKLLISRFDSGVAMLFTTSTRSMMEFLTDPISTRICWILAAEYIVANVALFFLGKRALEKGVNVD